MSCAGAEKLLSNADLKVLAQRLRAARYIVPWEGKDYEYGLHVREFGFVGSSRMMLDVVGCGVECDIWIEGNKIYANDGLPDIEGVKITPCETADIYDTKRYT